MQILPPNMTSILELTSPASKNDPHSNPNPFKSRAYEAQHSEIMASTVVNVFFTTMAGMGLPPTVVICMSRQTSLREMRALIEDKMPIQIENLIITTMANKKLPNSDLHISALLPDDEVDFLSLRLSIPMCGGKGGFGSQLRAAGGRMSSKGKKNQGENNASSRTLDGRRVRTINEAKALAEYLVIKPEMERKEKEKRRQRWEQVVELAEKREQEIKSGSKGKLDGAWLEEREDNNERAREAVRQAMKSGSYTDNMLSTSHSSASTSTANSEPIAEEDEDAEEGSSDSKASTPPPAQLSAKGKEKAKAFFGFDDDDEFMSSEDDAEKQ